MRLDKYLSQSTGFSRKEVKRMLHANEVQVNGAPERNPAIHVSENDLITLSGYAVDAPKTRYLMVNKPLGLVCSHSEPEHPSIMELLELPRTDALSIAGRLDIDTTGLVLLSDDGQWCHRITSPKHKLPKIYQVVCADPIGDGAVERFQRGLMLNGEKERTQPAQLEITGERSAQVTLTEGRYHQVKRMFAALGNRVESLHRDAIGSIRLDDALFHGEYRELTEAEVQSVYHVAS